jgi:hypothetical protein
MQDPYATFTTTEISLLNVSYFLVGYIIWILFHLSTQHGFYDFPSGLDIEKGFVILLKSSRLGVQQTQLRLEARFLCVDTEKFLSTHCNWSKFGGTET